ncbi:TFIIS helical bundle-like domain containing protein [Methylobacterium sp. BTF04]|nr:TFIIS helical bundle-like domain containing protein [Methylobacterium sp. BTF04]NEU14503.1 TFIIS helical bundle-like domain containing protein [Methylobacterium sp. BTF04]
MSLIGRLVSKILGNEDRPVVRDDRNDGSSSPLGRLVTKILRK